MSYKHVDRAEFRKQFEAGLNRPQLATHFGCDQVTVARIRKALDLPEFAGTPRRMDADRRQRIQALLDDGCSFAEITRTEGADHKTLRRHFPGQQWTKQQRAEWQRILNQQTARRTA